jgi:hypothetical protein
VRLSVNKLAGDAPAIGAEREPQRNFAPARGPAREQQAREIRTTDEEHDRDRGHQHAQRRAERIAQASASATAGVDELESFAP